MLGMKTGIFAVCILSPLLLLAQVSPSILSGRWEAEAPGGPWTFDLIVTGDKVTGTVFQHAGVPGPAEIYDGKLEGAALTFKTKRPIVSPDTREITFTGRIVGSEIVFERSVPSVNPLNPQNPDIGVFGTQLTAGIVNARRIGPVPAPAVAWIPGDKARPADITGRWESLRWNLDQWVFNLKSAGDQVTGDVSMAAGPGRQGLVFPQSSAIYDAKLEGNLVTFKTKSPDNVRTISFTGKIFGDEIAFVRHMEVPPGGAGGFEAVFGATAPFAFLTRRAPSIALSETVLMKEIQTAEKKWTVKPFTNYEFTASWRCLCPLPTEALTYTVQGNVANIAVSPRLAATMGVNPNAVRPILLRYGTIEQVFGLLNAASAKRPHQLKVEYDATLGYPTSMVLHPGGISTEENLELRITNLRALN
jgi:hypothetical protein